MEHWTRIPAPDSLDVLYRRADGMLVVFHSANKWMAAEHNGDFLVTKQNKGRVWKTPEAAMAALDRERPYVPPAPPPPRPRSRMAAWIVGHVYALKLSAAAWITGNG